MDNQNSLQDISDIKEKVNKLYTALMGDDITQNGGMVKRLVVVEQQASSADKRSKANALLIKWIIGTGTGILMALYSFIIKK